MNERIKRSKCEVKNMDGRNKTDEAKESMIPFFFRSLQLSVTLNSHILVDREKKVGEVHRHSILPELPICPGNGSKITAILIIRWTHFDTNISIQINELS